MVEDTGGDQKEPEKKPVGTETQKETFERYLGLNGLPDIPEGLKRTIDMSVRPSVSGGGGGGKVRVEFRGEAFGQEGEVRFLSMPEPGLVGPKDEKETKRRLAAGDTEEVVHYFLPSLEGVDRRELQILRFVLEADVKKREAEMLTDPALERVVSWLRVQYQRYAVMWEEATRGVRWDPKREFSLGFAETSKEWLLLFRDALGETLGKEVKTYEKVMLVLSAKREAVKERLRNNDDYRREHPGPEIDDLIEEQRGKLKDWDGCIAAVEVNFTPKRN